ncbi:MAG: YjdJ family protein [Planococcus sp. (in: firmicutes)]
MQERSTRNMREVILFFGALIFFAVATFLSLYEGSQLDDVSWEWPYSAIFSNWLNGGVESAADILTIDYLMYAAKFEPLFPIIMFISAFILLLQLASWIFRKNKIALSVFYLACGVGLFVVSGVFMSSPTVGLEIFSRIFFVFGIVLVISGVTSLVKARKQEA